MVTVGVRRRGRLDDRVERDGGVIGTGAVELDWWRPLAVGDVLVGPPSAEVVPSPPADGDDGDVNASWSWSSDGGIVSTWFTTSSDS